MAKDFLLEIGTEEIPAKFAPGTMQQLEEQAQKRLSELRLNYERLNIYATPRRFALLIKGLAEKQEDFSAEVKGPAVKAAYDQAGAPTKAAQGFARGQGVKVEDLYVQELKGVPYVYARKAEQGKLTETLLPELCQELIASLHFPKPMRWGDLDVRFARPIRWLVALFGDKAIPFEFASLTSGRTSRGHRTLASEPVQLAKADDYVEALKKAYVIVDPVERQESIRSQIKELVSKVNGQVYDDEELLSEVTHIVEYPTALLGQVADKYMHLPEAVITTPMREHQRYFPVRSREGKLLPYFVTVRNGDAYGLEMVQAGNEKVLKARLEDAAFYYREDQKVSLADLVPKLEKIVYHDKLGTVRDRVERLRKLSAYIAGHLGLAAEKDTIDRTAYLAKADLVTLMVYDFPELQGIMGAEYAAASHEIPEVCQGIIEHYQPRFAGDALPCSVVGKVVSMADKLDAIVGAFGIGIQPTGSQDPYALRRQAQGIVGIIMEAEWELSLTEMLQASYGFFKEQGAELLGLEEILPALQDFFQQRLRFVLQEQGFRYDTLDAVLDQGSDRFYSTAQKAAVLGEKRKEAGFSAYAQAYIRCFNLTKKASPVALNKEKLIDPAEIALAEGLSSRLERWTALVKVGEYAEAYKLAGELVPLVESLFAAVMIMVDDEELKQARLALISQCVEFLGCLGNLSLLA